MRVLLLGASGMLGSSLGPALRRSGHDVIAYGCSAGARRTDVTDRRQARECVDAARPDVVINLVAFTDVDGCEQDPRKAWRLNVLAAQHVAEACVANHAHLIHLSTDQLYDGDGPHREEAAAPGNVYAITKHGGELAAAAAGATVLRTNFVGASPDARRRSLTDWLFQSLREGREIPVFEDVLFSPLSIGSLCRCLEMLVHQRVAGTFNLGSRNGMSKADFAFAFAGALGLASGCLRRSSVASVALKAWRPRDMRLDCSRVEAILGQRMPALADEIILAAEDYRAAI
jgi:dTDP-4-dehydrorhamnose reductase